MNHDAETEALRRALRGLPEEAPPPSVWLSLQVRHALEFRQPRPQRWRIALAAAGRDAEAEIALERSIELNPEAMRAIIELAKLRGDK